MRNWVQDGQFNCKAGVSSAFDADDLGPTNIAWAKNVSIRGGKPHTRPVFVERMRLPKGRLQGAAFFSPNGGAIMLQVDGRLFRVDESGAQFSYQFVPALFLNSPRIPKVWMQETDGSLVIQDGQSAAIIYDGATARRSDPAANEIPIGRMMAYGNGRLWVAINDHEIAAGDIKVAEFQSELRFTEIGYFLGGGAFYFPRKINALSFLPLADTSSGLGELVVFGRDFADTLRADVASRDLWADLPRFRATALPGIGAAGQTAVVQVNQDLYFRCGNGEIRSFRSSRLEQNLPGNSPISREVSRLTEFESEALLESASSIYFDGRLLMTASPFYGPRGQVCFRDIISLDLSPLSSNQGRLPPAYDGEWEGMWITNLLKGELNGEERAFITSCDADGNNRLWEIMKGGTADVSFGGVSRIKSSVEYRKFAFGAPNTKKRLEFLRVYLADLKGEGTMRVDFRSDNHAQWIHWDEFNFSSKVSEAETAGELSHKLKNLSPQFRSAVGTLTAPEGQSDVTNNPFYVGFMFQIRLSWTGCAKVDRIEIFASPLGEAAFALRDELPQGVLTMETKDNEISYLIPLSSAAVDPDEYLYANQLGALYKDQAARNYTNA